ncbi:hypothetical protein E2562_002860 [Oryza meyeriana var. granulata]|uniref:Uncharacterized protein n=1 Tax=Oryza meyeriana var. granulata TaxID=110450 RepID=A0A6G1BSU6_9ORYZ|nr:hypothetical protein E2562_002860 [Oryza meyeriana var. granulata]
MWGVLSLFRRRRRTARVVDESVLGHHRHAAGAVGDDARGGAVAAGGAGALMARALLAMSCVVRLDGEGAGGGAEEAWATSGWRPPRADEVSHLMVRESMRYTIYA